MTDGAPSQASRLGRLAVPAAVVGIASALTLIVVSVAAERAQDLLWDTLPGWFGLDGTDPGWIVGVLAVVGAVTGILVVVLPGHAGPDPATTSLLSPPLPPMVLPGLAVVVVIGLGGGVSLGPENPIIAINVGLAVWIGRRAMGGVSAPQWMGFAAAGTIGALFATPVGAALLLSERPSDPAGPGTWDRLFAPLVAAGFGSLTMYVLARPIFVVDVPAYSDPSWGDVVSAPVIALVGVGVGLAMLAAFPVLHSMFHRFPTVAMLSLGGVVLGVLGALGGAITMFKGLDEMKELVARGDSGWQLAGLVLIKATALVVAASCGFRGGKIFPAAFIGVAIGLLAHQVVDAVPLAVAVSAAVLGILLVVSHSGWLSLFMAATIVGQVSVLPILCLAVLPAWLLVTDRPEMEMPVESVGGPA